ncbi:MAG: antibiotic biosynthesis monooxygenase [Actinobacteria bacterium]|nr:antibiotic biosynthesis monooxygenase [Actinomycetota bacterium]
MTVTTVTKGLFVQIEAKQGNEGDVRSFLEEGLALVNQEPDTTAWFAVQFGPTSFGIFDVFPREEGREAHLSGKVAEALMENAGELFDKPNIEKADVIAAKLPA